MAETRWCDNCIFPQTEMPLVESEILKIDFDKEIIVRKETYHCPRCNKNYSFLRNYQIRFDHEWQWDDKKHRKEKQV